MLDTIQKMMEERYNRKAKRVCERSLEWLVNTYITTKPDQRKDVDRFVWRYFNRLLDNLELANDYYAKYLQKRNDRLREADINGEIGGKDSKRLGNY